MLIVGELINASRKSVKEIIENRMPQGLRNWPGTSGSMGRITSTSTPACSWAGSPNC
jgi:hypothetical protein